MYWGKSMLRVAPQLIPALRKWERCSWKYLYNLPPYMRKETDAAKDELVQGFTAYYALPMSARMDAMEPVSAIEGELRNVDFEDGDVAKVNMLWHWAYVISTLVISLHLPSSITPSCNPS